MSTSLKHTLNPSFALLFAVGVDRLYKVIDPLLLHRDPSAPLLIPGIYLPITMVGFTLILGTLSSIANDKFIEAKREAPAISPIAWFSYISIICVLWMFYFSVDLAFVRFWWVGYAMLCVVNAVWNRLAVKPPYHKRHVGVNVAVALILFIIIFAKPSALSNPVWFYALLLSIVAMKWWQRRSKERFEHFNIP